MIISKYEVMNVVTYQLEFNNNHKLKFTYQFRENIKFHF